MRSFLNNLSRRGKLTLLALVILIVVPIIIATVIALIPKTPTQKLIGNINTTLKNNATDNNSVFTARATSIIFNSGGYIYARTSAPSNYNDQNDVALFKVNKDGTVTLIASAFGATDPANLFRLGVPMNIQERILSKTSAEIIRGLCNFGYFGDNDPIGYTGFDQSFVNNTVQIESSTIDTIRHKLNNTLIAQNTGVAESQQVICVSAITDGSSQTTNPYVNVTTAFNLQFITHNGTVSVHRVEIVTDMNFNRTIMLDGKQL